MKNVLLIVITAVVSIFGYRYYEQEIAGQDRFISKSALIEEQLKNVSKLVVTEGHYSEIINYRKSKDLLGPYFSHDWLRTHKTALIVVNADASIAYDLGKIEYELDDTARTLYIKSLPEPEITLTPDIEYLDMKEGLFNEFEGDDYNTIKEEVTASMMEKIEDSKLKTNAENRLMSELAKLFSLTDSVGWKLVYDGKSIESAEELTMEGTEVEG